MAGKPAPNMRSHLWFVLTCSLHLGSFSFLLPARVRASPRLFRHSIRRSGVNKDCATLPSGLRMEYFTTSPVRSTREPLIFIHGSFHGGWCWAEHWMSWFTERGHPCYAISLRGTSGSMVDSSTVLVEEHVQDIAQFLDAKKSEFKFPPVLVGHSFGGVMLMKFIESRTAYVDYGGAAFLCSVPPSGNGPMTMRFLRKRPIASLKIVAGFVAKLACVQPTLCRDLFFGDTLDECMSTDAEVGQIDRYMARFKQDSAVGLDLKALSASLPSRDAGENGVARWLTTSKDADKRNASKLFFVLGGGADYLVDEQGISETARFLGLNSATSAGYTLLPDTPHDVMLGKRWRGAAEALAEWLDIRDPESCFRRT